jgi:hypothetical protein
VDIEDLETLLASLAEPAESASDDGTLSSSPKS